MRQIDELKKEADKDQILKETAAAAIVNLEAAKDKEIKELKEQLATVESASAEPSAAGSKRACPSPTNRVEFDTERILQKIGDMDKLRAQMDSMREEFEKERKQFQAKSENNELALRLTAVLLFVARDADSGTPLLDEPPSAVTGAAPAPSATNFLWASSAANSCLRPASSMRSCRVAICAAG
jgi:hypothetical protein